MKILSTILGLALSIGFFGAQANDIGNFEYKLTLSEQGGGKYGVDSVRCITELLLYQNAFNQWKDSNYQGEIVKDIIQHWRWVFLNAPRSSEVLYVNGLKIVDYYLIKEKNKTAKNAYLDTLEMIYEGRIKYFPNHYKTGKSQIGILKGRFGVDLFNLAPERYQKAYALLKESVYIEGDVASWTTLVYYLRATDKMVKSGNLDDAELINSYNKISYLVDINLQKHQGNPRILSQWEVAKVNIDNSFETFATNVASDNNNRKNNLIPSYSSGATSLSLPSLFKQCNSAVFLIYTSDGDDTHLGSGFFVSSDGIGISNYHVFEGTTKGLEIIKLISGEQFKIERVIAQSVEDDYIIFKVKTYKSLDFLNVAAVLPEIGEQVFAIGNPYGLENTLSTGIISGYRGANSQRIQTTAEITHGSSGGALFNMMGEVIGITTSGFGDANLNFAINIQLVNLKRFK